MVKKEPDDKVVAGQTVMTSMVGLGANLYVHKNGQAKYHENRDSYNHAEWSNNGHYRGFGTTDEVRLWDLFVGRFFWRFIHRTILSVRLRLQKQRPWRRSRKTRTPISQLMLPWIRWHQMVHRHRFRDHDNNLPNNLCYRNVDKYRYLKIYPSYYPFCLSYNYNSRGTLLF